jgi:hypothetical protein
MYEALGSSLSTRKEGRKKYYKRHMAGTKKRKAGG